LGGLRYACQLDDDAKADLGTDKGMAPHIFNLTDADKLNGTVTEETTEAITGGETEAPTEAPAETPTEAPTAAPETQAPETETETEKSGCGSVIGMTAATLVMAAAAAVVLAKKD
jgi:hypothetical protein